ncbi:unnamed protein product [Periconia digitata]|uniref:RNA helicase aquarius N-terminal domain-containing protein n=1 Tax=Periconia digitata TaxID=1303443 RepID=A0A9W4XTQ3_9PLEO|nr:unnamed protein product [Periconia digitata]
MEDRTVSRATSAQNAEDTHATDAPSLHARPTVADLHGENHFAQVARKNWLGTNEAQKVRPEVIKKELWDELEKIDFAYPSLLVLENLQLLERYLWPTFTEDASNYHHLLLALMINVKRRENLPSWGECCNFKDLDHALTSCRTFCDQTFRIFRLLPSHTFHDHRLFATDQDSNPTCILCYWRVSITGQWAGAQGMRPFGWNINMAQPAFRNSAGRQLRESSDAEESLESCAQAIRGWRRSASSAATI